MDLTDNIIDYIEKNRVSSTEVADCLGKTGLLDPKLKPILPKKRAVGKVFYAPSFNGSNWYTHYFLQHAPENHIIFIEAINCGEKSTIGSLVAKYAMLYKRAKGIINLAPIRDAHELIKEEYPIWTYGFSPIGLKNIDNGLDENLYQQKKAEYEGSIIVADDCGVVIVKKEQLTEDFLQALKNIEEQEDIWFDCLDRLKYSTFEIVCQKKYLNK